MQSHKQKLVHKQTVHNGGIPRTFGISFIVSSTQQKQLVKSSQNKDANTTMIEWNAVILVVAKDRRALNSRPNSRRLMKSQFENRRWTFCLEKIVKSPSLGKNLTQMGNTFQAISL